MRVSNKSTYDAVKLNLGNIRHQLTAANQTASSGKRIHNLSDDPVGLIKSLRVKSDLAGIDQIRRNINLGKTWLNATESTLTHIQGLISEAKALSVQMTTSTTGQDERSAAGKTVENMLAEAISLANTQVNGRYIFAGLKTDAAPFSQGGTYSGDTTPFSIKIGQTDTFAIGNDGSAVFGNVLTSLSSFKNALEANNVSGIMNAMDDLDLDFDHITESISDVGARVNRVETKENILQDSKIVKTDQLSTIEDADIAEAIVNLKQVELAYQAALSSSANIMQLSLVNYFR